MTVSIENNQYDIKYDINYALLLQGREGDR
jgi:hypothetical protein